MRDRSDFTANAILEALAGRSFILLEDGAKWLGIVLWVAFFASAAARTIGGRLGPPDRHAGWS